MKPKSLFILVPLSIIFWIGVACALLTYHHETVDNQFKKDYQSGDRVAQLYDLLSSDRYAKDLRKAGYKIPNDGGIRYDGLIESVEFGKPLKLKIPYSSKDNEYFSVYFTTKIDGKLVYVTYNFDKHLKREASDSDYQWQNQKGLTENITIPKSDEDRLVRQVQKEVDDFLDTMYKRIYK